MANARSKKGLPRHSGLGPRGVCEPDETLGHVGMIGPECTLPNRKSAFVEQLGLGTPARSKQMVASRSRLSHARMIGSECEF